jgi:uncharacterized protein
MGDRPEITDDQQADRFVLADDPDAAHLAYRTEGDRLVLTHTEVDDDLEGEGVGSALVRFALDHAEERGLTVVPVCNFVAGWLERHPDRAAELDVAEAS